MVLNLSEIVCWVNLTFRMLQRKRKCRVKVSNSIQIFLSEKINGILSTHQNERILVILYPGWITVGVLRCVRISTMSMRSGAAGTGLIFLKLQTGMVNNMNLSLIIQQQRQRPKNGKSLSSFPPGSGPWSAFLFRVFFILVNGSGDCLSFAQFRYERR